MSRRTHVPGRGLMVTEAFALYSLLLGIALGIQITSLLYSVFG